MEARHQIRKCSSPLVQVVDAQCGVQGDLLAQTVPAHGLRVVPERRVQVSALHQLRDEEHAAHIQIGPIELHYVFVVQLPENADLHKAQPDEKNCLSNYGCNFLNKVTAWLHT